jgi:hypothetical protein
MCCSEWSGFHRYFVDLDEDGNRMWPYFAMSEIKTATNACNRVASFYDVSKDTMLLIASLPGFLELRFHVHSFKSCLPSVAQFFINQEDWIECFRRLSIILDPYNIKNRVVDEGSYLSNPLLVNVTLVECESEKKEVLVTSVKKGKVGKHARKKLLRKENM